MGRPRALGTADAYATIQRLLARGTEAISFAHHGHQRAREREFNRRDVQHVLTTGTVGVDPEWDARFEQWKYRVAGRDLDGEDLTLIVAIDPQWNRITIITGF